MCQSLDKEEIELAMTRSTSSLNKVYGFSVTLCVVCFFTIITCLGFILFLNSSQSEETKYLFGRMYMFSSFLIVLGSIILWIVYIATIKYQLKRSGSLMVSYADAECF